MLQSKSLGQLIHINEVHDDEVIGQNTTGYVGGSNMVRAIFPGGADRPYFLHNTTGYVGGSNMMHVTLPSGADWPCFLPNTTDDYMMRVTFPDGAGRPYILQMK